MVEYNNASSPPSGMTTWRAGCGESRTSGSEGGPGKPTSREADRAPRSDPYTEHPTREGKVYCCVVLDTYSRRVVGWSIDASPTAALVTNALGMAIDSRLGNTTTAGTLIHSDQGVQGEFNRSSQHLEFGGVHQWQLGTGARRPVMRRRSFVGSGVRIGRCGRRCVRRGGPIPHGPCSASSGG